MIRPFCTRIKTHPVICPGQAQCISFPRYAGFSSQKLHCLPTAEPCRPQTTRHKTHKCIKYTKQAFISPPMARLGKSSAQGRRRGIEARPPPARVVRSAGPAAGSTRRRRPRRRSMSGRRRLESSAGSTARVVRGPGAGSARVVHRLESSSPSARVVRRLESSGPQARVVRSAGPSRPPARVVRSAGLSRPPTRQPDRRRLPTGLRLSAGDQNSKP